MDSQPNAAPYHVVIARYNEPVEWVRVFDKDKVTIFNKGDASTIPKDLQPLVVQLPNVGREPHTYLTYIVENYDKLPERVVFSQGKYQDHVRVPPEAFKTMMLMDYAVSTNVSLAGTPFNRDGLLHNSYHFRIADWNGPLRRSPLSLGAFYESITGKKYEPFPCAYWGAIFSVRRDRILRHPKKVYEDFLASVSDHNAPEEGHYMERLWWGLFYSV